MSERGLGTDLYCSSSPAIYRKISAPPTWGPSVSNPRWPPLPSREHTNSCAQQTGALPAFLPEKAGSYPFLIPCALCDLLALGTLHQSEVFRSQLPVIGYTGCSPNFPGHLLCDPLGLQADLPLKLPLYFQVHGLSAKALCA